MKLSTETASIASIVGEKKAIETLASVGFNGYDFTMCVMSEKDTNGNLVDHPLNKAGYLDFVKEIDKIAKDNGIICNQTHAPFKYMSDDDYSNDLRKKAIECTAILGGEICVVHPLNDYAPEQNAEMYYKLLPFAKSCGVKIATENMWNWDYYVRKHALPAACSDEKSFLDHINAVNDEYLVACLDIGHSEMKGLDTCNVKMIETLKNHIKCLHIHDNDLWHDNHQIPFSMQIDFMPIIKALKKIEYDGWFTLEACSYLNSFNQDNYLQGVKDLYESVKKIENLFLEV